MEAIKPHALRDASYLVEGDAARALGRTRQAAAFDVLVDLLDRPSWYDVVRAGAIDGLAILRDERAVPLLGTSIRYGHPTRVRRASAIALPKIAGDRKTRETLENLLEDPDPIFRIDVVRALGDLADGKARPALRERLDTDNDPRVRRHIREALRDLNEPKRAAEPLREELDKLQDEHRDLKSRLAKLEAQVVSSAPRPPRGRGERAKTDEPKREPKPRGRKKRKKG
jgi:aminopeptidase N